MPICSELSRQYVGNNSAVKQLASVQCIMTQFVLLAISFLQYNLICSDSDF